MEARIIQISKLHAPHPTFALVQICGGAEALKNRQAEKAHETAQTT